jgi:hypothetical protein
MVAVTIHSSGSVQHTRDVQEYVLLEPMEHGAIHISSTLPFFCFGALAR